MNDFDTFTDTHLAGEFDDRWDGFEDESDWEYDMQFGEHDGWSERDDYSDTDLAHDAAILASAGWGTDEDYGWGFDIDFEPPF